MDLTVNFLNEKQEKIISDTLQSMEDLSYKEAEDILYVLMQKIKTFSMLNPSEDNSDLSSLQF